MARAESRGIRARLSATWRAVRDVGLAWKLLTAALCGAILLVAADAQWNWSRNIPVVMTVLTGLLQLALVGAVVDAVVKNRERKRVNEVGRIMFRALAQLAFDGHRRFDAHLTGAALEQRGIPGWSSTRTTSVRSMLAGAGLPTGSSLPEEERDARLRILLRHHAFVCALYLEVSTHKRQLHDTVGHWAPLLLATDASASDLRHMRDLADRYGDLHQELHHGAAMHLPAHEWRAHERWIEAVITVSRAYLRTAEQARAFYHRLAEEQRRTRDVDLDATIAVTAQPPQYLELARMTTTPSGAV